MKRNECIARRAFATLILDSEYPANGYMPAVVFCRILVDGWYRDTISAETREKAIELFNNWEE